MVMLPLSGALSDRIGRKLLLVLSASAIIIFADEPLFILFDGIRMRGAPLLGQISIALLIGLFDGASPAAAAEAFPANIRCTGVGIAHNLTMALLGGTAPLVVLPNPGRGRR